MSEARIDLAEDGRGRAAALLAEALLMLDDAGEATAAIHVSHALALIDGTGGKLPPSEDGRALIESAGLPDQSEATQASIRSRA